MNTLLPFSGVDWLQAALMALIMLGLGLEGMDGMEEILDTEATTQ
ncbi:MAG: hypothetical protein Fur0040_11860 [Sideroxydans sp.]